MEVVAAAQAQELRTGDVTAPIELKVGEIFDFTVRPGLSAERDQVGGVTCGVAPAVGGAYGPRVSRGAHGRPRR